MIRNALRVEDLVLGAANLVGPWLLGSGIDLNAAPNAGLGLVMLLALAGAVACIGLRPNGQPSIRAGGVETPRYALVGPLLGALWLVGAFAGEQLGMPDGSLIGTLGAVAAGLAAAGNRFLPVVRPELRRALVTPFVLVCTGIFLGFTGGILSGLDVGAMIRDAPAVGTSFALFVAIMLLGGLAAFYAMFVAAPRALADPEARAWVWVPRFILFVVTAVLGVGPTLF